MARGPDDRELVGSTCSGCPGCPADGIGNPQAPDTLPTGTPLVLGSMGIFLGPLVMALLGAAWFDRSGATQLAGAVGGLAVGMTASMAVGRLVVRLGKEDG